LTSNDNNKENQDEKIQFPSSEKLEDLLESRYEQEFSRKETLDEKANNMMTIASTVATLYGGFGLLTETELFTKGLQINLSLLMLLIGVSLLIGCIIIAAKSYSLRNYQYILKHDYFDIKKDSKENDSKENVSKKKDEEKMDVIDDFRTRDPTEFSRLLIENYQKCIKINFLTNDTKADDLEIGQIILLIGVASLPLFILISAIT